MVRFLKRALSVGLVCATIAGCQGADVKGLPDASVGARAQMGIDAEQGIAKSVEDGVQAYRAKDFGRAWGVLKPLADQGVMRAQRYAARMLLEGTALSDCTQASCASQAIAFLTDAARRGDNNALLVLEGMRTKGAPYAPSLNDIIAIERARVDELGDPLTAWRLAARYRAGEIDEARADDYLRWLTLAAEADKNLYPNAPQAAYLLCSAYATGEQAAYDRARAKKWCARAAEDGHVGARLALARLDRAPRGPGLPFNGPSGRRP